MKLCLSVEVSCSGNRSDETRCEVSSAGSASGSTKTRRGFADSGDLGLDTDFPVGDEVDELVNSVGGRWSVEENRGSVDSRLMKRIVVEVGSIVLIGKEFKDHTCGHQSHMN